MANKAIFLPEDDKILQGYIEQNYDRDQLSVIIYSVQQTTIKDLIGSGLYDELETQINANTLTALNTTLLTYIQDALRFYVLAEFPYASNYKFRNKGVQTMEGDKSSSVGAPELGQLTQRFMSKAQIFSERVTRYLQQNIQSFPLYSNPGNGLDTIRPHKTSFSTGWYMGTDRDEYVGLDQPSQ